MIGWIYHGVFSWDYRATVSFAGVVVALFLFLGEQKRKPTSDRNAFRHVLSLAIVFELRRSLVVEADRKTIVDRVLRLWSANFAWSHFHTPFLLTQKV